MSTHTRERRLWLPPSTATSFSPYSSSYPQPLEAVWAGDPQGGYTNGVAVASARNGGNRGSGPPVQATGANQPLFRSVGIGLRPSFQFDGTDDYLDVDIADISQPLKIVAVVRFNDLGTNQRFVGGGSGSGTGFGYRTGQGLDLTFGAALTANPSGTTNTQVLRATLNGASSQVWLNGSSLTSGNAGANALTHFTVGATYNGTNLNTFFKGHVAYAAIYDGTVSDAALAVLEADLIAHYAFNPLTQVAGLLHGVWASDPLWAHPADGAAVASWRNQSGGGDPAQATGANQPLWRLAGINNQPSVQFDGTDDYLDFNITDVLQPYKSVCVAKVNSLSPSFQAILGKGQNSAFHGIMSGNGAGTFFDLNLGTELVSTFANDTNPHVWSVVGNGASSSLSLDGGTPTIGNAGTGALFRFLLGASSDGVPTFSRFLNGHIGYVGIFPGTTSDQDLATLVTNLRTYYGTA